MQAFRDKSLVSKIRFVIILLAFSFLAVIAITSAIYYFHDLKVTVPEEGRLLTERVAPALDRELYEISRNFVFMFGTEDFADDLYHVYLGDRSLTETSIALQDELTLFLRSSYLIDSVLFLFPDRRQVVTIWEQSLKKYYNPLSSGDFDEIDGITYLPLRTSPFESHEDVIPIVFPLRYNYGTEIVLGKPVDSSFIIAYVNIVRLRTLIEGDKRHELSLSKNGLHLTGEVQGRSMAYETVLPLTGIVLTDFIDTAAILSDSLSVLCRTVFIVLVLVFILLLFLNYILALYVTKPVKELEMAVKKIEAQNYSYVSSIEANDELGGLSRSISRMGHTIEAQINRIEQEKNEKYQMEIRLLSEQLKPHFIYNTLECIQQEIKRDRTESALDMVREFSLYLRTALNYGKDTITINEELRHDLSYVRIMNHRFSTEIKLTHWVDDGLEEMLIPKSLVQPFIENSIKHGFPATVSSPQVDLSFQRFDDSLVITIADNGIGFDEDEFMNILLTDFGDGHVGLRNSYKRLCAMYPGNESLITVSSVPYYRSEIHLRLPGKC